MPQFAAVRVVAAPPSTAELFVRRLKAVVRQARVVVEVEVDCLGAAETMPPAPCAPRKLTRKEQGDAIAQFEDMVQSIVAKQWPYEGRALQGISRDDICQTGRMAVLEAVQKHEPGRGRGLVSWVYYIVEQKVRRHVREARGLPRDASLGYSLTRHPVGSFVELEEHHAVAGVG